VRGHKVMLDADLAELYGVSTGRFNEQVRRNRDRFPSDFMFQLTNQEVERLRSQIAISIGETKEAGRGGRRYLPLAFTEHGAIMAATILNTPQATEVSVFVVRAFVRLREMAAANKELAKSPQRNETHAALSRFWRRRKSSRGQPRVQEAPSVKPRAKTAPAHNGLRPESPLALSLGLPIFQILAAPRFAPLPILARTARAFHHVAGSRNLTNWSAASRITTRPSPASSRRFANSPHRPNLRPDAALDSSPMSNEATSPPGE